ncbi:hypothetical protein PCE1_000152 [Barthelona sp. PCE]
MKLDESVLSNAPRYSNALGMRELNLSKFSLTDLDAFQDYRDLYDSIRLAHNRLTSDSFTSFGLLQRLQFLDLSHNRIESFSSSFTIKVPNVEDLVLENNRIASVQDLESLKNLKKLTTLILIGNPITEIEGYPCNVLEALPQVRYLDYQKKNFYFTQSGSSSDETEQTDNIDKDEVRRQLQNATSLVEAMRLRSLLEE